MFRLFIYIYIYNFCNYKCLLDNIYLDIKNQNKKKSQKGSMDKFVTSIE